LNAQSVSRLTPPQWSHTTTPLDSAFSDDMPIHLPHWLHLTSTPPSAVEEVFLSLTLLMPVRSVGRLRPSLEAISRIELGLLLGSWSRSSWKVAELGYMLRSLLTSASVQPFCLICIMHYLWVVVVARDGDTIMAGRVRSLPGFPGSMGRSQFSPPQGSLRLIQGTLHPRLPPFKDQSWLLGTSRVSRATRNERPGLYMIFLLQGWFITVSCGGAKYIPLCRIGVNIVSNQ